MNRFRIVANSDHALPVGWIELTDEAVEAIEGTPEGTPEGWILAPSFTLRLGSLDHFTLLAVPRQPTEPHRSTEPIPTPDSGYIDW